MKTVVSRIATEMSGHFLQAGKPHSIQFLGRLPAKQETPDNYTTSRTAKRNEGRPSSRKRIIWHNDILDKLISDNIEGQHVLWCKDRRHPSKFSKVGLHCATMHRIWTWQPGVYVCIKNCIYIHIYTQKWHWHISGRFPRLRLICILRWAAQRTSLRRVWPLWSRKGHILLGQAPENQSCSKVCHFANRYLHFMYICICIYIYIYIYISIYIHPFQHTYTPGSLQI